MAHFAAFLRAVNLGSTRKASSADLVAAFEEVGLADVATFRNSGNVVFSGSGGAGVLRQRIERGLNERLGFEVPAFIRSEAQLKRIAARKPFPPKALSESKGKLQVAFLERKPGARAIEAIEALATEDDRLRLDGTELYWLPKGGTQDSPLDMRAIDETLGLNTLRTMGTVEQLYAKFF